MKRLTCREWQECILGIVFHEPGGFESQRVWPIPCYNILISTCIIIFIRVYATHGCNGVPLY